jgi:hypothetical protein
MTPNDAELLQIYLMAAPFLVVGLGLFVFWLTGWMDRRERQRRPAE